MRDKKIAIISAVVVLLAAALCYGLCFKVLDGDSAETGSELGGGDDANPGQYRQSF